MSERVITVDVDAHDAERRGTTSIVNDTDRAIVVTFTEASPLSAIAWEVRIADREREGR